MMIRSPTVLGVGRYIQQLKHNKQFDVKIFEKECHTSASTMALTKCT